MQPCTGHIAKPEHTVQQGSGSTTKQEWMPFRRLSGFILGLAHVVIRTCGGQSTTAQPTHVQHSPICTQQRAQAGHAPLTYHAAGTPAGRHDRPMGHLGGKLHDLGLPCSSRRCTAGCLCRLDHEHSHASLHAHAHTHTPCSLLNDKMHLCLGHQSPFPCTCASGLIPTCAHPAWVTDTHQRVHLPGSPMRTYAWVTNQQQVYIASQPCPISAAAGSRHTPC